MTVNIHTEWGKLKEVIVGDVLNLDKINVDTSFKLFYHANIKNEILENSIHLKQRLIEQRKEDLDNLSKVLESFDVKVLRPEPLDKVREFSTPNFTSYTRPFDNPRDLALILGNKIIETPVLSRTRYFETDQVKPIFYDYFKKGANWISAPRPTLTDDSFDYSYVKNSQGLEDWSSFHNVPEKFEIMFDAAQCLKFGRDIVMNVSTENHKMGADWLQRTIGDDYRIHKVGLTDHHIDGMFMPLRPGTLLINPSTMYDKIHMLPKALQKWDMLVVPEGEKSKYSSDEVLLASSNITVNVLSIDEEHVLVFDEMGNISTSLMKTLERKGFTPIPIRLRHSRVFDGGIHCATLDMVRDEKLEDYFS